MFNAFQIRLYPNASQETRLSTQFGCARWVWNDALAKCIAAYKATGKSLNYRSLASQLPALKSEHEWLKEADSQALQQSLQYLSRAYENFFAKRGRFPRFKSKHGRQSYAYPQRVKLVGKKIYLPKVGWVRCVIHREIIGRMKTVTISRNSCGQFYASILTDDDSTTPTPSCDGRAIGIDVGLHHLVVTSDGSKFDNPRHLRLAEANLRRKHRALSRKVKGSANRKRARQKLARAYARVTASRKDFLHKLSRRLINENQVIAVETLNVKGMTGNHNLAKSISDAGWRMLISFLEYKAIREGKLVVKINRWFPSSKACSCCNHIHGELMLNSRSWKCRNCGTCHDRDINAAKNIRDEGSRILAGGYSATACGG